MLEIDQRQLDSDEFLLNTPTSTYDLRLGLVSAREHTATDFITKQTTVDPADEGMDIWQDALETLFCGDADLIRYVQEIAGLVRHRKSVCRSLDYCLRRRSKR